ncbi:MmcQ/YjbR family DNA-binding protein [Kitasatospora sp. NPDC056327]|uniref:MmcQ/YjbR family DNA-binding protein n=1 Tax=Kitasatospora sp. NPDC056327 TaxID=3345785 RepID=UPI0035DD26E3
MDRTPLGPAPDGPAHDGPAHHGLPPAAPVADRAHDGPAAVERLRAVCLALPGVEERVSHGEPTWFAGAGRRARVFVMLADHHHDDRLAFWCPAAAGAQEFLVTEEPERFFRPPYVGHRGWIGVRLDVAPPLWERVEDLVSDAHALVTGPARRQKRTH